MLTHDTSTKFLYIIDGPPRWPIIQHQHDNNGIAPKHLDFTLDDPAAAPANQKWVRRRVSVWVQDWIGDTYHISGAYFIRGRIHAPFFAKEPDEFVGYYDLESRRGWIELYHYRLVSRDDEVVAESINKLESVLLLMQPLTKQAEEGIRLALAEMRHHQAVQRVPGHDPRYGKYDRESIQRRASQLEAELSDWEASRPDPTR